MRRYDSYKDSGVEWIGEIPIGWKKSKIKYHFQLLSGYPFNSEDITNEERQFPIIRIGNVTSGKVDVFFDGEIIDKHPVVENGDYIISLTGDFSIRKWENHSSLLNQRCGLLKGISKNDLRFLFYFLPFQFRILEKTKYFTTLKNLSNGELLDLELPLPPLSEQQQIVSYLDTKTSQIDSLIEKTQRKIQLLKENRTSLINEVVTKGLNPNVEMKDSGVEWIGEIPSHWGFIPIKYSLIKSKDSMRTGPFGSSLKSDEFIDEGIRVYNQRSVYDEDFSRSEIFVSEEKYEELKSFEVRPLDILITSRGTIGKMTIVPIDGQKGVLHPCLIRLRIDRERLFDRFLWFYVNQSSLFIESVLNESNSTTIEVIYSDTLSNVRFPFPPISEQSEIVSYLDEHTQLIDKTISIEERRIDTLKEYRQSLISEVVTGKRKVTTDE